MICLSLNLGTLECRMNSIANAVQACRRLSFPMAAKAICGRIIEYVRHADSLEIPPAVFE